MRRDAAKARNIELAKIHIAKAQLRLDDDTYRDMLWTVGRVRSAKDLTSDGRRHVLNHLRSRGFKDIGRGRPHNADKSPQIRKVEALLADAKRPWSYADAMARRMFQVDRVTFCTPQQLQKLIAALVIDQRRHKDDSVTQSRESAPGACQAGAIAGSQAADQS